MLLKSVLTLVLAACGVSSNSPTEYMPPEGFPKEKEHYFCCQDVDPDSHSGTQCTEIPESAVIACNKVLYCDKGYTKDDGKIKCNK